MMRNLSEVEQRSPDLSPLADGESSTSPVGRRKKTRRNTHIACVNCSKWHVSCEAKRPCHRCISKGLESTCVDAPRKKSKYLAGIPDDSLVKPVQREVSMNYRHEQQKFQDPQHIVHKSKFLSNAADSEYSILSHIINQDSLLNKIPVDLLYSNKNFAPNAESTITRSFQANVPPHPYPSSGYNVYSVLLGPDSVDIVSSQVNLFVNHFPMAPVESPDFSLSFKRLLPSDRSPEANEIRENPMINQYYLNNENLTYPEVINVWKSQRDRNEQHSVSFALECCSPDATRAFNNPEWEHSLRYSTPMEVYTLITEPFSHTPGFHHLFTYLRKRFNKQALVEMCRSLAEFRPIFIACSVTLTEEDMIFMEQCYQRTLLEYSKFIVQTGTPTCVWRRNGQISYVNEEFEILTGWNREELLNKMTFIVEILDDRSVEDYFKTFSKVAYKDFKGSEQMQVCNILSPIKGLIIECCCMWTLKRDVSGLPLMILGNFMPILN